MIPGFRTKTIGRLDVYLPKNPTYSDRLLYLMAVNKISQNELARKSGVPQASIANYLYKGRIPKFDTAAKLAVALGVTMEWMAGIDISQVCDDYGEF